MDSAGLNVICNSRDAPGASSITLEGCGVENVRVRGEVKLTLSSLLPGTKQ